MRNTFSTSNWGVTWVKRAAPQCPPRDERRIRPCHLSSHHSAATIYIGNLFYWWSGFMWLVYCQRISIKHKTLSRNSVRIILPFWALADDLWNKTNQFHNPCLHPPILLSSSDKPSKASDMSSKDSNETADLWSKNSPFPVCLRLPDPFCGLLEPL